MLPFPCVFDQDNDAKNFLLRKKMKFVMFGMDIASRATLALEAYICFTGSIVATMSWTGLLEPALMSQPGSGFEPWTTQLTLSRSQRP